MADDNTELPPPAREVKGGLGTATGWLIFGQAMAAIGAVITFLGLADTTWVVRTFQFLRSEQAVPVIGFVMWMGGGFALWWRTKGRTELMAFMGALLPNQLVKVTTPLSNKVQRAVDEATAGGPVVTNMTKVDALTADVAKG